MGDRLEADAHEADVIDMSADLVTGDPGYGSDRRRQAMWAGKASAGETPWEMEIIEGEVAEGDVVEGDVAEGEIVQGEIVQPLRPTDRAGRPTRMVRELTDDDASWFPLQTVESKESLPWDHELPVRPEDHVQAAPSSLSSPDTLDDLASFARPPRSARRLRFSGLHTSRRPAGDLPPLLATPEDVAAAAPATTAPLRLAIGVASLASLLLAGAGQMLGIDGLRTAGVLVFCFLGTGSAPWQLNLALETHARLALSFVTSLAVMTLIPFEMLFLDQWYPGLTFGLVAGVCVLLHVVGLVAALATGSGPGPPLPARMRALVRASSQRRAAFGRLVVAAGPALVGASMCLLAALSHRHIDPVYGFLPRIGLAWFVGLGLVLLGVVLGVARGRGAAISTILLTAVLTLTPALTYDGPRSQSAAKHVDFVTQISRFCISWTRRSRCTTPGAGSSAAMAWVCQSRNRRPDSARDLLARALGRSCVSSCSASSQGRFCLGGSSASAAVALAVLADSIGRRLLLSPQSGRIRRRVAAVGFALARSAEVRDSPWS